MTVSRQGDLRFFRHPRLGRVSLPRCRVLAIPAYAGMTVEVAGMTVRVAGMTGAKWG
jgi:hypothetical protein